MSNTNGFEGLDPYSINLIVFKTKRLCRQAGFTQSDIEDIEMDLSLYLRSRLIQYDPKRGAFTTFVNCVLENRVRELVHQQTRATNDQRRNEYSLNETLIDVSGDPVSRGDLIEDDAYAIRLGNISRTRRELVEMQIDVSRALQSLPEEWQEACTLMADYCMREVSRITGISWQRLYVIRKRVQKIFREYGLEEYL